MSDTSPATATPVAPASSLVSAVEKIDRVVVAGWCFDANAPDQPVLLGINVNQQRITYVRTTISRQDLRGPGTGALNAGFELFWGTVPVAHLERLAEVLRSLPPDDLVKVDVVRESTGQKLSQEWLASQNGFALTAGQWLPMIERLLAPPVEQMKAVHGVVMTGMHRSGTSAMAEALHALGLWMGEEQEFWPPPDRWNPNGYFESAWVVKLNDHLLQKTGHLWNRPPADDLAWQGDRSLVDRVRQVAVAIGSDLHSQAQARQQAVWGFKDPRASVVWELWNQALPVVRWIVSIRHPLEVAQSLVRRDKMSLTAALNLVRIHFEHLSRLVKRLPDRCTVVCYANFLAAPQRMLEPLARWCGLSPSQQALERAAANISSAHRHHGLADLTWPEGFEDLRRTYLALRQLSLVPGRQLAAKPQPYPMNKTHSSLQGLDQAPDHRGAAERIGVPSISGWCVRASSPSVPAQLTLICEGVVLAQITTQQQRPDLADLLLTPCPAGFVFHWVEAPESTRALLIETLAAEPALLDERTNIRLLIRDDLELDTAWALSHGEPLSRRDLLTHLKSLVDPSRKLSPQAHREATLAGLNPVQAPMRTARIQPVAFYLPQFQPTPENNEWWGQGFTEWTQVTAASPRYPGHPVPRRPSELGYYDLRTPGVMTRQIELAQSHGLLAFCFHHYWMEGKRLLNAALEQFLALDHDFGFCINWANETWSRRWDGSEHEVLMQQTHRLESDLAFFSDALPLLLDRRYLKVEGNPLLLVYRVSLLSQPREVFDRWREMARDAGLPGLHIAMVESFGFSDPKEWGCDSSVQFPPHNLRDLNERPAHQVNPGFRGKVFEYPQVVAHALNQAPAPHRRYQGLMLGWDNSARRGDDAHIYADYEPGAFELWLEHCARLAEAELPEGERYVFINAWNEWSEGAYLEPDYHWGRAALEAVRAVVNGLAGPQTHLALLRHKLAADPAALRSLQALSTRLQGTSQSLDYSLFLGRSRHPRHLPSRVSLTPPPGLTSLTPGGRAGLESLMNQRQTRFAQVAQGDRLTLRGWSLPGDRPLGPDSLSFLCLRQAGSAQPTAYALINHRQERHDVLASSGESEETSLWCGWSVEVELGSLPPGQYQLSLAFPAEIVGEEVAAAEATLNATIEVLA